MRKVLKSQGKLVGHITRDKGAKRNDLERQARKGDTAMRINDLLDAQKGNRGTRPENS